MGNDIFISYIPKSVLTKFMSSTRIKAEQALGDRFGYSTRVVFLSTHIEQIFNKNILKWQAQ